MEFVFIFDVGIFAAYLKLCVLQQQSIIFTTLPQAQAKDTSS
jgi:hypothetical protein